ncbi:hypothetical protein KY858_004197 [Vibrio vulnificus]|nr:hypothetical protein [Vibrio vulnificus]EHZ2652248.1 hypothetical protein [Vibrio vulnificus]EIX4880887.1 hypothetical protein [Vibrio vulnificus]ELM0326819.1 hypothetical protein [Vibrio vulnificus]EME0830396.1 hypothetical protein [Vibrio vulnificus]
MGIKFYLANLKIHGLEFSKTNKGNIRNLITLSVQGMQLELYIEPDVWSGDIKGFKGKFIESGYILAKDATISEVPELREIVSNICTLLSLGTDSQVRFFKWESLDLSHSDEWCVNGFYNFCRPPISIKHP